MEQVLDPCPELKPVYSKRTVGESREKEGWMYAWQESKTQSLEWVWKERKHREDGEEAQWAECIYAAFGFNAKGGRKVPEKSLGRNTMERRRCSRVRCTS